MQDATDAEARALQRHQVRSLLVDARPVRGGRLPPRARQGAAGGRQGGARAGARPALVLLRRAAGRLSGRAQRRRQGGDRLPALLRQYVAPFNRAWIVLCYPPPSAWTARKMTVVK